MLWCARAKFHKLLAFYLLVHTAVLLLVNMDC
jgi:hypothetical protein